MQSTSDRLGLPATCPDNVGGSVPGPEYFPLAIYSLVDISVAALQELVAAIDFVIEGTDLHLVRIASDSALRQNSLADALGTHAEYGKTHKDDGGQGSLEYYPYAFLAVSDEDWAAKGLFLVAFDFEEPYTVTGFRMRTEDAQSICTTVQNDDDGIEVLKEQFEFKLE